MIRSVILSGPVRSRFCRRRSSVEVIECNKSLNNLFQEEVDRGSQIDRASLSVLEFVYVENGKILNTVLNEGIGFVKNVSKKAAPHHSNAEGNGITNATVGLKAQFILTTRAADGRQCYNEQAEVTLEIHNQQLQRSMTARMVPTISVILCQKLEN